MNFVKVRMIQRLGRLELRMCTKVKVEKFDWNNIIELRLFPIERED